MPKKIRDMYIKEHNKYIEEKNKSSSPFNQ